MPVLMHILGALIVIAGLLMTGFAIPIRDFSFGNTLILAGAIAFVGGVIVVGLGSALRELRKLARLLQNNGAQSRPDLQGGPLRSPRVTGPIPQPAPFVPRPSHPEPRIDVAMDEDIQDAEPLPMQPAADSKRPSIFALVRGARTEHFEIDESESVPLSPVAMTRGSANTPAMAPERTDAAEAVFEPRPDLRNEPRAEPRVEARSSSPSSLASRTAARIDMPRPVPELPRANPKRAEGPAERDNERPGRNLFDTVWPTEAKREPSVDRGISDRAAAERHNAQPMFAQPEAELRKDAFELAHAAVREAVEGRMFSEPEEDFQPRQESPRQRSKFELKADARPEPKPVTILKSGVIDGMAYTLYTDGSIEAQLPSGLMRFSSIDDLRSYLERSP